MASNSKTPMAKDQAQSLKPAPADSKPDAVTSKVTGWLKSKDLQPPT